MKHSPGGADAGVADDIAQVQAQIPATQDQWCVIFTEAPTESHAQRVGFRQPVVQYHPPRQEMIGLEDPPHWESTLLEKGTISTGTICTPRKRTTLVTINVLEKGAMQ